MLPTIESTNGIGMNTKKNNNSLNVRTSIQIDPAQSNPSTFSKICLISSRYLVR